jgi:hypothetical protein
MVSSVGGSFAHFARNAGCTVTTDLHTRVFFFLSLPMSPHVPYGLRGLPFLLWPSVTDF